MQTNDLPLEVKNCCLWVVADEYYNLSIFNTEAVVPCVKENEIDGVMTVKAFAEENGYSLILNSGSIGVTKCEHPDDPERYYAYALAISLQKKRI